MKLLLPLAVAVLFVALKCQGKLVICYYTNCAQLRPFKLAYFPRYINTSHCTHLSYAFAAVRDHKLVPTEFNDLHNMNYRRGMYWKFNQLKKSKAGLKTLLAVDGRNSKASSFSQMAETSATRRTFVDSAVQLMKEYNFDGLDLNWKYSAWQDSGWHTEDQKRFTLLCKDLRAAFEKETRNGKKFLLTAAVGVSYKLDAYNVTALNLYLDYISLMSYDLHGAWDNITGHNAGLYNSSTDRGNMSVAATAEHWIKKGAEVSKFLIGLPLYGRTFKLVNPAQHGVGAPANVTGNKGPYTNRGGLLAYFEVCDVIRDKKYTIKFDNETKTPYAYKGNQWITYDDANSLLHKMKWLKNKGFGGATIWAYDQDDFLGSSCGFGKYPLMNVVSDCLLRDQCGTESNVPASPYNTSFRWQQLQTSRVPITPTVASTGPKVVMCYFTNWSQYRPLPGRFFPKDIDPNLCTHMSYAFAGLRHNEVNPSEWNDRGPQWSASLYARFNELKARNTKLKTLLAVGGWKEKAARFSQMADSSKKRKLFIESALQIMNTYNFDGLDINWVYPAKEDFGGRPVDKVNFIQLLKELRENFYARGRIQNKTYLLSTSVGASDDLIRTSYNVSGLNRYVDFIRIVAYDLCGSWEGTTGHSAGLYDSNGKTSGASVSAIVQNWMNKGASPSKILVTIGFHGRTFKLANTSNYGVGAATSGAGNVGVYTRFAGILAYYEVCDLIKKYGYTAIFDSRSKAPYMYNEDQWVSYENVQSIKYKLAWFTHKGLRGVAAWSFDLDDFNAECDDQKYPLLTTINTCYLENVSCSLGTLAGGSTGNSAPVIHMTSDLLWLLLLFAYQQTCL